jgi:hypothetical protein
MGAVKKSGNKAKARNTKVAHIKKPKGTNGSKHVAQHKKRPSAVSHPKNATGESVFEPAAISEAAIMEPDATPVLKLGGKGRKAKKKKKGGALKKIGTKVKRLASLKNVIGLATGNYLGVAKDAIRVASTKKPSKHEEGSMNEIYEETDEVMINSNTKLPSALENFLTAKGAEVQKKEVDFLAKLDGVQNASDQVTGFMSKVYAQSMWEKHKSKILIVGGLILGFVVYIFGFKKSSSGGRRRR